MTSKPDVSCVINVRNEAENLDKCLKSIRDFCQEIIIVDMHSTDGSIDIAQKYNCRIFSYKPLKYVEPARNFGISKAQGRWILLLDPDEVVPPTLKKELQKIILRSDVDFVKIPRMNLVFGKWLQNSNMWPDYLIRFFKKGSVTWQKEIHSQPVTVGNGINLLDSDKLAIKHHNYPTITHFIHRALRYSSVQADELLQSGYRVKVSDFLLKPTQEFNSRFFAKEGFKDGLHGLVFCLLQSFAIGLIYLRLWEKQGSSEKNLPKDSFVSSINVSLFEFQFWLNNYLQKDSSLNPIKKFIYWLILKLLRTLK